MRKMPDADILPHDNPGPDVRGNARIVYLLYLGSVVCNVLVIVSFHIGEAVFGACFIDSPHFDAIVFGVWFFFGAFPVVGVIIAYFSRNSAAGWVADHYRFQIRTFWIGLFCSVIGAR